jgi:hypothetical protein
MSAAAPPKPPEVLANEAVSEVLRTQWDGEPALRLDSPPGAGKTWVVERLAVQSMEVHRERCMISTQTNEQGFDLARRLSQGFPNRTFHLFARKDLLLPDILNSLPNLVVARSRNDLPPGPCVVISNAAKWSWIQDPPPFDLQIVDEAFQLPDYRFQQIANLARRFVLVGDPGQIAPVVTCEIERWRCDKAGPHVACPKALVERHPGIKRLALPVSRRLVEDTVRYVQPAFYPGLPFTALSPNRRRRLQLTALVSGRAATDAALDLAARGASVSMVELPAKITGEVDEELALAIVRTIERLIARRATIVDDGSTRMLDPSMIGIVCAHVSQVNAIRERLPGNLSDVFVETSDRFQGLERHLMFVHHPLSGRADATAFHLEAGRLCVMMSRHRVACWLVGRAGISDRLLRYAPSGDRTLGIEEDAEFEGWRAHISILQKLVQERRVISFSG